MCISVSVFALNCWFIVTQWCHRILFMLYIFYQAILCTFNKHFDCHYACQHSHSEKKQTRWNRGRVFRGEFTEAKTAYQMYSPASVIVCWTWCVLHVFLCVYRWAHSPPAPCAACRPCGKPQGWFGCTGRRWEGQRGSSLCCRYLCCPWKPAAQRHGEVRHVGWRGDAFCGICCLRWSKICWNCEHDTFI